MRHRPLIPAGRATVWLLAAVGVGLAPAALAQKGYRPPPHYLQFGKPDQAKGREILEQFRAQGITGDYYLEFELRVLPWHGPERVLSGRLWGARNAAGPISRVSVRTAAGDAVPLVRLLVQGGAHPSLWQWRAGAEPEQAGLASLFAPVAGTDLTAFDLQMPFLYWEDFVYEGLARMRGRPAHQFLFYPPADISALQPELKGVRVYLDTEYTALVEAQLIGTDDRPLKTLSLLDLQKVEGQWIVKSVDLRDDPTRNKTRFAVVAAALNRHFPATVFSPADLARTEPAPPAAALQRLASP